MHETPLFVAAIVALVAVIGCGRSDLQGEKSAPREAARSAPAPSAGPRVGNLKAGRVLFLGNSITLHGPLASVSWANNWGMAASAADKDYVHLLSDRISVAGTSKWNKIEHRLFCHITQNWRGRPLVSHDIIVQLIASTTTAQGLRVQAALDRRQYPLKKKVTPQDLSQVHLLPSGFHGDWNYTIVPV